MQTLLQIFGAEASSDSLSNTMRPEFDESSTLEGSTIESAAAFSLDLGDIKPPKNTGDFSLLEANLPKIENAVERTVSVAQREMAAPATYQLGESDQGSVALTAARDTTHTKNLVYTSTTKPINLLDPPGEKAISTPEYHTVKTDTQLLKLRGLFAEVPDTVKVTANAEKIATTENSEVQTGKGRFDHDVAKLTEIQGEKQPAKPTDVVPSAGQTFLSPRTTPVAQVTAVQSSQEKTAEPPTPKSQNRETPTTNASNPIAPKAIETPQLGADKVSNPSAKSNLDPELPIKANLETVTLDRPVPHKPSAQKSERASVPIPSEIQHHSLGAQKISPAQHTITPTDLQSGRALPDGAVAKVQQEATPALLVPKNDAPRRDSKSATSRTPDTTFGSEVQIQSPTQTKSSIEGAQQKTSNGPVLVNVASPGPDVLQSADTSPTRDSGFQPLSEGSEIRKESLPSSKIETFARPVVSQLTHALKTAGDGSIEVRLAPDELGRVRLSLNPGETHITVNISAERPETMDLIKRNIELFSQSLKQEGFTNLSFSFTDQGREQNSAKDGNAPSEYSDEADNFEAAPHSKPVSRTLSAGNLDIRL